MHKLQLDGELARECALNELYGLGYDFSFHLEQRLRQITAEDLYARLFNPERMATADHSGHNR